MNKHKKKNLENKGWIVGNIKDFLKLSPEEVAYIELKLLLSKNLHNTRINKKITQEKLAKMIKSSQSRIAKMEAGDRSVSFDLLIRALIALGASREKLYRMIV